MGLPKKIFSTRLSRQSTAESTGSAEPELGNATLHYMERHIQLSGDNLFFFLIAYCRRKNCQIFK
jgi:hypothetical protein